MQYKEATICDLEMTGTLLIREMSKNHHLQVDICDNKSPISIITIGNLHCHFISLL